MKRRYSRPLTLATAVFCFLMFSGAQARADTQAELDEALKKIDVQLYEQSQADVRAWLDARIAKYGDFGVYEFWADDLNVKIRGDRAEFSLGRGGICDCAAQMFRAYEMLGNKKYLDAGLKTADVLLHVQQPQGHFAAGPHGVDRNGRVSAGGQRNMARIQDGYQFRPFALLLYAYKLTGEKKYIEAARRCADLFAEQIQHPIYGWCPDNFDAAAKRVGSSYGSHGGSYNDSATSDPMRMTIMMYHLTGDTEYLARTAKLGDWIFATQLGEGKVRGWCQQYQANNKPANARGFEQPVIGPRTWNRFVGPMLTWLYATTGDERYRTLFEETYAWMRSVEVPGPHAAWNGRTVTRDIETIIELYAAGLDRFMEELPNLRKKYPSGGWAYQYQPDGAPIFSSRTRGGGAASFRYDKPESWPRAQDVDAGNWRHLICMYLLPHSRIVTQLDDSERVLKIWQTGGVEALRDWYKGPVKYTSEQYAAVRLAAAKRCADEQMTVIVDSGVDGDTRPMRVNYLDHVRKRWISPKKGLAPEADGDGRAGLAKQAWRSIHCGGAPYRPPIGWAQWQYVWDVRLAQGKIDSDTAATGGRGMETYVQHERWNVAGDWTTRAVEVEDWMNVPMVDFREHRIPASNATSVWGYYGVSPESPDGKRLCYVVYPEPIDLGRQERYPVYPAELWVCNRHGGGHRMLSKGHDSVHNGLSQSWVDNTRIVFAADATCIVNADTGKMNFGPFEGFTPAHSAVGGKVLMHNADAESPKHPGLHELDTATGEMRLVLPYTKSIHHAQYSPDGRKVLFTTNNNYNLTVVRLDGTGLRTLPGRKPMHFQWFDDETFFGYADKAVVGVDLGKHRAKELYRWDLDGKIIEQLAGYGCHGAARADRAYFVGESWYRTKPISLRLYARGGRDPLTTFFSHSFFQLTWQDGGRHHVNPSFSRDGTRIYYNKAVNENTSQAFCYDLTGLVEPIK